MHRVEGQHWWLQHANKWDTKMWHTSTGYVKHERKQECQLKNAFFLKISNFFVQVRNAFKMTKLTDKTVLN
jgi:hypothetical protein